MGSKISLINICDGSETRSKNINQESFPKDKTKDKIIKVLDNHNKLSYTGIKQTDCIEIKKTDNESTKVLVSNEILDEEFEKDLEHMWNNS